MAALLGAMGCGSKSSSGMDHGTSDMGTGGDGGLTVELTSPPGRVYTRGMVTLQVVVSGGTADSVTLLLDGQPLATLAAPLQYSWDTATFAEGSHQVLARAVAHGKSFDSAAREVVIDRTAPTVVNRAPAPGSANVRVEAPVVVKFSEPLAPATITDGNVRVLAGSAVVTATRMLSDDGTTLTVTPSFDRGAAPAVHVELAGLTDLAGNPLALPGDPWSWTMPEWVAYGDPLTRDATQEVLRTRMQVDAQGRPVVLLGSASHVYASRWSDSGWQSLGDTLDSGQSTPAPSALALDPAGNPVAALATGNGGQLVRWDEAGQAWKSIPANVAPSSPSVVVDPNGGVLWGYPTTAGYQVDRWTSAGGWTPLDTSIALSNTANSSWLHLDAKGTPYVLSCETGVAGSIGGRTYLYRFDGTAWTAVGDGYGFGFSGGSVTEEPSLAFDATGAPVVARAVVQGFPGQSYWVTVFRYDGTAWKQLGANIAPQQQNAQMWLARVLADSAGHIELFYDDNGTVPALRWDGTDWQPLGPSLLSGLSAQSFVELQAALDPAGRPVVATFDNSSGVRVAVHRFNRNP
jgi:hypothetical protein